MSADLVLTRRLGIISGQISFSSSPGPRRRPVQVSESVVDEEVISGDNFEEADKQKDKQKSSQADRSQKQRQMEIMSKNTHLHRQKNGITEVCTE